MTVSCRSCRQLAAICQSTAAQRGYIELYDGARRHWDQWEAPAVAWTKGIGPCSREEAERRIADPTHPWYRRGIRRAETHKAMNALIQGSAARHTKLWMRACLREGIVPLLQMHDSLDCSVSSPEHRGARRTIGARGGQARGADADRSQVWPQLGRRQAHVGRAPRNRARARARPSRNRSRSPWKSRRSRRQLCQCKKARYPW